MISTTFIHQFSVGDFAFCNPTSETVEITQMIVTMSVNTTKVTYCVKRVTGPEYWVQETDLTAIKTSSTLASITSNGTYTIPTSVMHTYTYTPAIFGTRTIQLPDGLTIDPTKLKPTKCECGAEKVGSNSHSSWCSKNDSLGLGV